MPTFAAIDIGSNSCRLAIASVRAHKLKVLHEDREVTRLGESVFQTGDISPEAMANTIKALKRFQKATQTHVVDRVRVVATSAMRDARNADAFRAWVKSTTGWNVEVISGLEEGRLIHLGVATYEPGGRGRCLLIDLGGGSCEITLSDGGRIRQMVSLPLGAVRLQQEFLRDDPPAKDGVARLEQYIERELRRMDRRLGKPRWTRAAQAPLVIATSGTAAALCEASEALVANKGKLPVAAAKKKATQPVVKAAGSAAGRPDKKGRVLQAETGAVRALARRLLKLNSAQRAAVPGIGPRRAEIITGGAQVYAAVLERLGLKGFRYSPLGLRDGMLAQMLAETDERASVHRTMESERWDGVLALCRHYGVDPRKEQPVVSAAEQLFDGLARVHELPDEFRLWLRAAAMMHEVGKYMNHQGHHRHTQYIIANSEVFGFTPVQRATVAAIARYLGRSRPEPMDRLMRMVPVEDHAHVRAAVVLLRLAKALDADQATGAVLVTPRVYPKRVVLELHAVRGAAELETWALRKDAAYFREIFRRELLIDVV